MARAYNGALAEGYKVQVVTEPQEGTYYTAGAVGRYILETADPMNDKLKEPIQLYEFETCPFCKKVSREVRLAAAAQFLPSTCYHGGLLQVAARR